jgi:hypothetical protein
MGRIAAVIVALGMGSAAACAQQVFPYADLIEQALTTCHDGVHAIVDADVEHHSIALRTGARELRVFFGSVGVSYDEQGTAGRNYRLEARLTLTCTNTLSCMSSAPWDEARASARAQFGIVQLSVATLSNQSLTLHCPDLVAAQALYRALQAFQRAAAP